MSQNLFHTGNLRWPHRGTEYLRVLFPFNLSKHSKVNLEPLLEKFKLDVERWAPFYISLWVKANVLKMNVVPKFNHILQALVTAVLMKYFRRQGCGDHKILLVGEVLYMALKQNLRTEISMLQNFIC